MLGAANPLKRLGRSFAAKFAMAAVLFAVAPFLVHAQLQSAEDQRNALLLRQVQEQGRLTAAALFPALDSFSPKNADRLTRSAEALAGPDISLRVLFRPNGAATGAGFFLIAAAPSVSDPAAEAARLAKTGILAGLESGCDGGSPLALRVAAPDGDEVLTHIAPHRTKAGCWAVTTGGSTADLLGATTGRSYWQAPEMRMAAFAYLLVAVLVLSIFADALADLRRFGRAVKTMRIRSAAALPVKGCRIAELDGAAEELDQLAASLKRSEHALRQAADESAHALKAPLAVISQALEPLRAAIPADDGRARRGLDLIEMSVRRLDGLVGAVRRMDETIADLIDPPRGPVDVSAILIGMEPDYRQAAAAKDIRLSVKAPPLPSILGDETLLETMIENLLENAVDFAPAGSEIQAEILRRGDMAVLEVRDCGPGIAAADLDRVFERCVTSRPDQAGTPHYGLGLWLVRRGAEAMGGSARAFNRPGDGLVMVIELPLAGI